VILSSINSAIDQLQAAMVQNLHFVAILVAVLWGVHLINWLSHYRLNRLGIYPRSILGLPGIVLSPLLHGDATHLLFNSIPFAVLSVLVLVDGRTRFWHVTLGVVLLGGGLTWLFGRKALHVGASGLVLGYMGYLMAYAYMQPSALSIILVLVMMYYFAGLLFNLFPIDKKASWEAHIFGFIAGVIVAV